MKFIAAILLLPMLIACGPADPTALISEGHRALSSSDSATAQAKFTEALTVLHSGDAQFVEAKLGLVEARIRGEPKQAGLDFLALVDTSPSQMGEKEFVYIAGQMVSAHKHSEAIDLITAGIKRSGPKSPKLMLLIERIKKEAVVDNDTEAIKKLKTVGYL